MQYSNYYGADIFCIPEYATCKFAKRKLCDMEKCPILNFDDTGDLCVPDLCEFYEEECQE